MRLHALTVLLLAAGLAGCIGDDELVDPASEAGPAGDFTPCEHPWPCADGSEWPRNLTVPEEHPRQPPVIPESLSMEDGEVVERNAENVTFEWTVPAKTALNYEDDTANLQAHDETRITVPSGLFLGWTIGFTLTGSGDVDGRQFQIRLIDAEGTTRCTATLALEATGQDGEPRRCTTGTLSPLDRPEDWTLVLEHQWDRPDDAEITVNVTARTAEPVLDIGLDRMEHVYVESYDGTRLEGWIFHPDLPGGVKAPVVLHATPYIGLIGVPSEPWAETHRYYAPLISNGYAVASFSVRGTGGSGGCYGSFSLEEQRDQAHVVDWLGEQDWSNGRVGMMGLSYHGTTPFEAAIHQPEHLKTIVPAGIVSDVYTFSATPQGALHPYQGVFETQFAAQVTLAGSAVVALSDPDPSRASALAEHACPGTAEHGLAPTSWMATDQRPEAYYDERRLIDGFPNITASVFVAQGLLDNGGHAYQEDSIWATLENAPKRMLLGQWGHTFPRHHGMLEGASFGENWNTDALIPWMDFWLKGIGDPADLRLGTVDYEDTSGDWHDTSSWPPADENRRALYLAGDDLAKRPGSEASSFRLGPMGRCEQPGATVAAFVSEPVDQRVVVAGNPFGYLNVESSQPGGAFEVNLLEAGPDVETCQQLGNAKQISDGGVDLRHHEGNFEGRDFPTNQPTPVRVDLHNQAWTIELGQRVALVVQGYADPDQWSNYRPEITIHPDSHLVLPVVDGDLGAELPDVDYPPRPFVPTDGEEGSG